MIYGFEKNHRKRDPKRKSNSEKNYEKLPKVRDIVVIDSERLDSTEGTMIPE